MMSSLTMVMIKMVWKWKSLSCQTQTLVSRVRSSVVASLKIFLISWVSVLGIRRKMTNHQWLKNLHCFTLRGLNERNEVDLKEFLVMGEITVPGIEMFGYDSFIQPCTSFLRYSEAWMLRLISRWNWHGHHHGQSSPPQIFYSHINFLWNKDMIELKQHGHDQ